MTSHIDGKGAEWLDKQRNSEAQMVDDYGDDDDGYDYDGKALNCATRACPATCHGLLIDNTLVCAKLFSHKITTTKHNIFHSILLSPRVSFLVFRRLNHKQNTVFK